ncbi:bile acid:sodium symporter family protein, partial [Streptomyces sp. JAC128]
FSVWHNISGALVAAWMPHRSRREEPAPPVAGPARRTAVTEEA